MPEDLMARIERKLAEAFAERWPNSPPMEAVLDERTGFDRTTGGVTGGLTIIATRSSGERVSLHHEPAGILKTAQDVDDWIARALSTLLARHPTWPH